MDLNIGAALWMAAQAEGQVTVASALTASTQQPATHQSARLSEPTASTTLPADPDSTKSHCGCSRSSVSHATSAAQNSQQAGAPGAQCLSTVGYATDTHGHASRAQDDNAQTASMSSDSGPDGNAARLCCENMLSDDTEQSSSRHREVSVSCGRYKSAARVVLLGHGADEQHAGYGRHRTSFRNQVSLNLLGIVSSWTIA